MRTRAVSPWSLRLDAETRRHARARARPRTRSPALWRVRAYSAPGLPSPTMSLSGVPGHGSTQVGDNREAATAPLAELRPRGAGGLAPRTAALLLAAFLLRGQPRPSAPRPGQLGVAFGVASLRVAPAAGAAAAPSAGGRGSASAVGSGSSARGGWIDTTVVVAPCATSGIVTPAGSGRSDRCFDVVDAHLRQIELDELRQVLRQARDLDVVRCGARPRRPASSRPAKRPRP